MKQSKATVIKPIMRSRTVLNKCLWLNALAFVLCVPAVQAFDDFSFSSGEKVISGKEEYLDVNISGGELRFLNTGRLLAKNISISGGTFSGPVNMRANNLEISGGDFSAGGDYTAGSASVWAKGMYNKARLSGENGFNSDSTGFAAGVEYHNDDSFKAGFGYVYTVSGINTTWSKTDADAHSGFVYGEYKPSAFYINGILSYGFSKYDEKTRLLGLKSEYDTETLAFQALTGYMFGLLTPEAGIRYTKAFQKSYINALGVKMDNQKLETWTGVVGMKVSKDLRLAKYMITPEAKISLTYDFQREDFKRTVTLANGSSYVVEGESLKRAGVEIGGGVSVKAGSHTDIGVSYEGKFKKDYADHTGLLNIKYNF
ncbi:MAG: autotransporter outer membrane beta-barrel domain-containing protein [Alphaproteobacteria bacterium]|nr:autotransporter outer membrane beta-barrel domain-containing protein [Alphaproteobacteria bacterium]